MNGPLDLERQVSAWLRSDAPERAPEHVLAVTLDRVAIVGQERPLTDWRFANRRTNRAALIAATAALIAILVGGAVLVGGRFLTEDVPPPPPSAPAVRTLGNGPTLTWTRIEVIPSPPVGFSDTGARAATRVVWLGDRFVLVDEATQTAATSRDGSDWTVLAADDPDGAWFRSIAYTDSIAAWEGVIAVWDPAAAGAGVRIRRPSEPPFVADFEGTVDAVGIGPAGIVVATHTPVDQLAFIESVLGATWGGDNVEALSLEGDVLRLAARDGRTASIDLTEHGLTAADFDNRGHGWHSVDGKDWTPIPEWPGKVTSVVGTADGFIALGDPGTGPRMLHSPDGRAWQRIAIATSGFAEQLINPVLMPWRDGALESDGTFIFQKWTGAGKTVLPVAAEVRSREHPLVEPAGIGAGPLGIVAVEAFWHEILYSPDGVEWALQNVPDERNAPGPTDRAYRSNVAVGTDAVVVVMSEGEETLPSLWVGTPTP